MNTDGYQELATELIGHVTVAHFRTSGPLHATDQELMQGIRADMSRLAAEAPWPLVTIDFSGISFFDAAVCGAIVLLYRDLKRRDGHLAVSTLPFGIKDLLTVLHLDSMILVSESLHGALVTLTRAESASLSQSGKRI